MTQKVRIFGYGDKRFSYRGMCGAQTMIIHRIRISMSIFTWNHKTIVEQIIRTTSAIRQNWPEWASGYEPTFEMEIITPPI